MGFLSLQAVFSVAVPVNVHAQSTVLNGGFGLPKLIVCGPSFSEGDPNRVCTVNHIFITVKNVIQYLIYLLVPISIGWFVYVGYLYVTAGGNQGQLDKAKTTFRNVFVGILIVLLAWVVVYGILNAILDESKGFRPLQINATNE